METVTKMTLSSFAKSPELSLFFRSFPFLLSLFSIRHFPLPKPSQLHGIASNG